MDDPDDAAVWQLDDSRALVVTTDFFTPVVDDPYAYGAIAAANSLSDIYAMGGRPFLCLNVAAFPGNLPPEIVSEILRGGAEKAREAGVVIAGGHTIQDEEPKYGLIALGFVDPRRMVTKGGGQPGDILVLSKPLGFGVTTTALKRQQADPEDMTEAISWMSTLNRAAGELALESGVTCGTDVTGFGLLGHAWELANASGVALHFEFDKIPFLSGAEKYANEWIFPGGTLDNRAYFGPRVRFAEGIPEPSQLLLFDAQTSGGLLLAVPKDRIEGLMTSGDARNQSLWIVGEMMVGTGIKVI